jgi:hypothetical protein
MTMVQSLQVMTKVVDVRITYLKAKPAVLRRIAGEVKVALTTMTMYYCNAFPQQ